MPYFPGVNRTVIAISLIAALLGGIALVFVWYMSFGLGQPASGKIHLASMRSPATLSYREDGLVAIEAGSEIDAYRALGYRTGRDFGWVASLLRQSAIGGLSEWFGAPVRQLDRFALTMGFGRQAQLAVDQLADGDIRVLSAFAEGMSAALADEGVALGNEFVLFDIDPEPWAPWHSLAIERMLAWLSEPPVHAIPGDSLFWPIRRHEDADRTFRSWLHLHGADMSAAWAWRDSTAWSANARLVYGATALPLYAPTSVKWSGVSFNGVLLIGTPFFPVVSGPTAMRIVLPSSRRGVETIDGITHDDAMLRSGYERIVERSGDEYLVSVARYGSRILLSDPSSETDSLFSATALFWDGLSGPSDWSTWRLLANRIGSGLSLDNDQVRFELLDGDGITVTLVDVKVTGNPEVRTATDRRVFVGNNRSAVYAARRLSRPDVDLMYLEDEDVSEWARSYAPSAIGELGRDSLFDDQMALAIEYLRNWDFRYDVSSIGASLFDSWMLHYRPNRGDYPAIRIPADSVARDSVRTRLREALTVAVDSLADLAGADLARWRLESFRPGRRFFPVWSYPPLGPSLPVLNRSRYAPIEIAQSGHPTALQWQPGIDDEPANSPSYILAGGRVGDPARLAVRPDYKMGSGFIARYIAEAPSAKPSSSFRIVDEVILTSEP